MASWQVKQERRNTPGKPQERTRELQERRGIWDHLGMTGTVP